MELLAEGCAFAKAENITETDGSVTATEGAIQNGDTNSLSFIDVIVVAHKHKATLENGQYVCECGFVCTDYKYENGVCTICGYQCPHPSDKVKEEKGADGTIASATCDDCGMPMAVKIVTGDTTEYYTTSANPGDTMRDIFTKAKSGSTITLLTDGLVAFAAVQNGKTITLDLNGKQLVEHQGITAGSDTSPTLEDMTIKGKAVESETPGNYKGTPCTFLVDGGTLELGSSSNALSGTVSSVLVKGGKVTTPDKTQSETVLTVQKLVINTDSADIDAMFALRSGSFGEISVSDRSAASRVTLGHLLEKGDGSAFQGSGGDEKNLLEYNTQITKGQPVNDVTVVSCEHPSSINNADGTNGNKCPHCGYQNIVAVVVTPDNSIATFNADSTDSAAVSGKVHSAFEHLNNGDGDTVTFYMDAALTKDDTIRVAKAAVIDLNGHRITGNYKLTWTGRNGQQGTVTITDSSQGKGGAFENNIVIGSSMASLTVDGVSVGNITVDASVQVTLKAGTTFTGYGIPSGKTLADRLEDGCCVIQRNGDTVTAVNLLTPGDGSMITGNFKVRKLPAAITASTKSGNVEYGKDVPESLRPTVTVTDGSSPTLSYSWRYKAADGSVVTLPSTTLNADTVLNNAYCVITAKDGETTLWATMVKGYTLTVTKAVSSVTTAPTAVSGLTYTGGEQALVTAGTPNGGTMVYSLEQNGTYSDTIPTATDAKAYTVWYKVRGDNNHNDSAPASVSVTIAPKEVTNLTITVEKATYTGTEQKPPSPSRTAIRSLIRRSTRSPTPTTSTRVRIPPP